MIKETLYKEGNKTYFIEPVSQYKDETFNNDQFQRKISYVAKAVAELEVHLIDKPIEYNEKNYKIDYKKNLSSMQFVAATTLNNPILLIASAGSGKTSTLTYRTSYMIENGVDPSNILILTFTKKASGEMLSRVSNLIKNDTITNKIEGGTFHSFAIKTLSKYADYLDFPKNYSLIDEDDDAEIIDSILKELNLTKIININKYDFVSACSYSINGRIPFDQVLNERFFLQPDDMKELLKIYSMYKSYKRANFLYNFDDILEALCFALEQNPNMARKLSTQYKYIMVDEYQDTNTLQKDILLQLTCVNQNIMAIGDESQSIYSFRSANVENILLFKKDFPNARIIKLEENYRSLPEIVDFSNSILDSNKLKYSKKAYSSKTHQNKRPCVTRFLTPENEVDSICLLVKNLIYKQDKNLTDIAIISRTSRTLKDVEMKLKRLNINSKIFGGQSIFCMKEIKDIICILRIANNTKDYVALQRILKLLPSLGLKGVEKILGHLSNGGTLSNYPVGKKKSISPELTSALEDNYIKNDTNDFRILSKDLPINYYKFISLLKGIRELETVEEQVKFTIKYYQNNLNDKFVLFENSKDINNPAYRMEDLTDMRKDSYKYLNYVIESAKYSKNLTELLAYFMIDADSKDEEKKGFVTLTTVHSAKGLEWDTVFVMNLQDGIFPSNRISNKEQEEEERRLFYVACTRAKNNLFLTCPCIYNPAEFWRKNKISKFIAEIDKTKYMFETQWKK